MNSVEYTKWIRRYNFSDVSMQSRPKVINKDLKSYYIVSSDFKREYLPRHPLFIETPITICLIIFLKKNEYLKNRK
jgi:hypothetical protein